jgi:hypothetical protein
VQAGGKGDHFIAQRTPIRRVRRDGDGQAGAGGYIDLDGELRLVRRIFGLRLWKQGILSGQKGTSWLIIACPFSPDGALQGCKMRALRAVSG